MNDVDYRSYMKVEQEKQRQRSILQAQEQLREKREERKELDKLLLEVETEQERKTYLFRLERNQGVSDKILSRLKMLGVTEKRDRPKKEATERYQEQRKKFTAHGQPETVAYLHSLKADGSIPNISAFLDELVTEHQKKNGQSV